MTTPNITGEPSKDKLKFIYNTHMVIIEVGIEKEHFVVHQSFLCAKSQYFTKALSGSFQEAVTRFIPLPDVSPILFRIFVAWIYHGKLAYIPPDDRTIDKDFDSLKITEKDCEKEPDLQSERQNKLNNNQSDSGDSDDDVTGPSTGAPMPEASDHDASSSSGSSERSSPTSTVQYEGDDATTWSCDVLIKLYVFSDRFDHQYLSIPPHLTTVGKMEFPYGATMATILAGPDAKKFVVHRALLCSKSQYFTKALTGSFEESQTGIVRFEDISPVLFQIFVTWLYNGKIVYTISDGTSTIKQDFKNFLECIIPGHDSDKLQMNANDTSAWPCEVLMGLYVLADRLDTKELRIQVMDALTESLLRKKSLGLPPTVYRYVYANTTAKSPLRKFAVDTLAYNSRHNLADQVFWMHLPHDLAIAALLTSSQRVPHPLCDTCYQKGLSRNSIDSPLCKDKDLVPYEEDMCLYHEHAHEEEKEACRARRGKAGVK
ncbi:hypothetical protein KCV07_g8846, partial [Aureobasidium melanogenum]